MHNDVKKCCSEVYIWKSSLDYRNNLYQNNQNYYYILMQPVHFKNYLISMKKGHLDVIIYINLILLRNHIILPNL